MRDQNTPFKILISGFGADFGGIVRVHNSLTDALSHVGQVYVSNAPRTQEAGPGIRVLTRQTSSRWRSMLRDYLHALTEPKHKYQLRVDSAPTFRPFTRSKFHVVVVHDMNFLRPSVHTISKKQQIYRHLLHRWTLRRCDLIVVNSQSTRAGVIEYQPEASRKILVLPLPVDDIFRLSAPRQAKVPDKDVLAFGHAANKGIDRILKLMAHSPDISLTVVCPRSQWDKLWLELASDLAVVHRVTVMENLSDTQLLHQYKAAGVFCMLSTYEGYGLPVAEALAVGTPTVISDLPVLREPSRNKAVVASPGVAALENAINEACSLDVDRWSKTAEEISAWSWTDWIEAMLIEAAR